MSIQGLLNRNGVSKALRVEDACLRLNRKMWLNRKVELSKSENTYTLTVHDPMNVSKHWLRGTNEWMTAGDVLEPVSGIVSLIGYIFTSVLLTIPLTVGLIAKKISIYRDPKAKAYQNVIEKALAFSRYTDEISEVTKKNKSLIKDLSCSKEEINKINDALNDSKLSNESKKTLQNQKKRLEKNVKKIKNENQKLKSKIKQTPQQQTAQSKQEEANLERFEKRQKNLKRKLKQSENKLNQISSDLKKPLNDALFPALLKEKDRLIVDISKKQNELLAIGKTATYYHKKQRSRAELEKAIREYDKIGGNKADSVEIFIDIHSDERMMRKPLPSSMHLP